MQGGPANPNPWWIFVPAGTLTPTASAEPKSSVAPVPPVAEAAEPGSSVAGLADASSGRIAVVDGLRGAAILIVMLLHFAMMRPTGDAEEVVVALLETGWIGVDLFFVLSGFLITGILWDARGGDGFFRRFYARRTLRIFPLYYAFLFVILIIFPAVFDHYAAEHATSDQRVWLWTYLGNVLMARDGWSGMPSHTTHLWSLAVEEQFYLIWPLVVFFLSRRAMIGTCLAILALSPLVRLAFDIVQPDGIASYTLLPARLDGLALGGLIALAVRGNYSLPLLGRSGRQMLFVGGVGLFALMAFGQSIGWKGLLPALDRDVQLAGYSLVALLFGGLLLYALATPAGSRLHWVLNTRLLQSFGKYSYGLYLFHVPLRNLIRERVVLAGGLPRVGGTEAPAQAVLFVGAIGLTWLVAVASWHVYEKHWLKLKQLVPYAHESKG